MARTGQQKQNTLNRYHKVLHCLENEQSMMELCAATGITSSMLFATVQNLIKLKKIIRVGMAHSKNSTYKRIQNSFDWDDYSKIYKGHEKNIDGQSSAEKNQFHDYPFLINAVPVNQLYVTKSISSDEMHINLKLSNPKKYFVSGSSLGMFE